MPINARGRSTKKGSGPPFQHVEYKGHVRHELPLRRRKCTGHQQIAGGSLARVLGSTYGSCDIYWCPWVGADIKHLGSSAYRHGQELGVDWVPTLKETSLVCHSAPVQEGLRT